MDLALKKAMKTHTLFWFRHLNPTEKPTMDEQAIFVDLSKNTVK